MLSLETILNNNYPFRNAKYTIKYPNSKFLIKIPEYIENEDEKEINSVSDNKNILHTNYLEEKLDQINITFFNNSKDTILNGLQLKNLNIPTNINNEFEVIDYIRNNVDELNNLEFCIINETNKQIILYKTKDYIKKLLKNELTNYPIFILLKKNDSYAYYYYPIHNYQKVQKVWNYERININEYWDKINKDLKKADLLDYISEKDYKNEIKKSWKKQKIFTEIAMKDFSL
jgi:hypothetical protein